MTRICLVFSLVIPLQNSKRETGPPFFEAGDVPAKRTDYLVKNKCGLSIDVSLFLPAEAQEQRIKSPVIVYCHSYGSAKIEGWFLVEKALKHSVGVCLFDFRGSGKSEGNFTTLGGSEKDDLESVVLSFPP